MTLLATTITPVIAAILVLGTPQRREGGFDLGRRVYFHLILHCGG
jgi:hypothetical protein